MLLAFLDVLCGLLYLIGEPRPEGGLHPWKVPEIPDNTRGDFKVTGDGGRLRIGAFTSKVLSPSASSDELKAGWLLGGGLLLRDLS